MAMLLVTGQLMQPRRSREVDQRQVITGRRSIYSGVTPGNDRGAVVDAGVGDLEADPLISLL